MCVPLPHEQDTNSADTAYGIACLTILDFRNTTSGNNIPAVRQNERRITLLSFSLGFALIVLLMSKQVISFRLAEEDLKVLDKACLLFNETRSQVVGRAIKSLLTEYVRQDGKLIRQPYWMPNLDGKFNAS